MLVKSGRALERKLDNRWGIHKKKKKRTCWLYAGAGKSGTNSWQKNTKKNKTSDVVVKLVRQIPLGDAAGNTPPVVHDFHVSKKKVAQITEEWASWRVGES